MQTSIFLRWSIPKKSFGFEKTQAIVHYQRELAPPKSWLGATPKSWRNETPENAFLLKGIYISKKKNWELFSFHIRKLQGEETPLQQNLKVQNPKGFTLLPKKRQDSFTITPLPCLARIPARNEFGCSQGKWRAIGRFLAPICWPMKFDSKKLRNAENETVHEFVTPWYPVSL